MSRRSARKHVLSILFQKDFNTEETLEDIIKTYSEEIEHISGGDLSFVKSELEGIVANETDILKTIENYASGWTVDRMSRLDTAILKIAIYEMLYCEDIPDKVSINEAVELAKEFSSDKAPGFINGILGRVIADKK